MSVSTTAAAASTADASVATATSTDSGALVVLPLEASLSSAPDAIDEDGSETGDEAEMVYEAEYPCCATCQALDQSQAFHAAVEEGDLGTVRDLAPEVPARDVAGAFGVAVDGGHAGVVAVLLEEILEDDAVDLGGDLVQAAVWGHGPLVEAILRGAKARDGLRLPGDQVGWALRAVLRGLGEDREDRDHQAEDHQEGEAAEEEEEEEDQEDWVAHWRRLVALVLDLGYASAVEREAALHLALVTGFQDGDKDLVRGVVRVAALTGLPSPAGRMNTRTQV